MLFDLALQMKCKYTYTSVQEAPPLIATYEHDKTLRNCEIEIKKKCVAGK